MKAYAAIVSFLSQEMVRGHKRVSRRRYRWVQRWALLAISNSRVDARARGRANLELVLNLRAVSVTEGKIKTVRLSAVTLFPGITEDDVARYYADQMAGKNPAPKRYRPLRRFGTVL